MRGLGELSSREAPAKPATRHVAGQEPGNKRLGNEAEAWEGGIREFDTAPGYGIAEKILGRVLKRLGLTDKSRIISKVIIPPGRVDADGLRRLIDQTFKHLGIYRLNALYEPCTNIRAGARYLRELLDRYNSNLHLALAAYNYGPGRIRNQAGAGHIPQGAKWYSSYIYHHLKYILQTATIADAGATGKPADYNPQKRLALITDL